MSDAAPLGDLVAAWAAAWESRVAARIIALWDKADAESYYLPAGSVEAYQGPAVVGLVQRRCLAAAEIGYRPRGLHIRLLNPDLGLAFFQLDWSERGQAGRLGGRVRVSMLMRRKSEGWRMFHYAEAPLAPLLELQAFYEAVAADGLDRIPPRP
jgi:hypothetical protein